VSAGLDGEDELEGFDGHALAVIEAVRIAPLHAGNDLHLGAAALAGLGLDSVEQLVAEAVGTLLP